MAGFGSWAFDFPFSIRMICCRELLLHAGEGPFVHAAAEEPCGDDEEQPEEPEGEGELEGGPVLFRVGNGDGGSPSQAEVAQRGVRIAVGPQEHHPPSLPIDAKVGQPDGTRMFEIVVEGQ